VLVMAIAGRHWLSLEILDLKCKSSFQRQGLWLDYKTMMGYPTNCLSLQRSQKGHDPYEKHVKLPQFKRWTQSQSSPVHHNDMIDPCTPLVNK